VKAVSYQSGSSCVGSTGGKYQRIAESSAAAAAGFSQLIKKQSKLMRRKPKKRRSEAAARESANDRGEAKVMWLI